MDAVMERLKSPWILAGIGLVLGLALGVFYAWQINPVAWEDATPDLLRSDLRADYLRMAIDSYSVNRDVDLALERYANLGDAAAETLTQVGVSPGEVDTTAIQNFRAIVEIMESPEGGGATEDGEVAEVQPVEGEAEAVEPEPGQASQPDAAGSIASRLLFPVCGVTLVIGLLLVGVLILRNRMGGMEEEPMLDPGFDMPDEYMDAPSPEMQEDFGVEQPHETEPMAAERPADDALASFRTIYTLGDDRYDDSFSIESGTGDFLGECGVGIGEVMGAGEPKKVSAFEVWLFDKNDIQTVTTVLMSKYAFKDEETRSRLSAKGEPVLAEPGESVRLETASLQVEARIVDMEYGRSALPNESYFERMTIELRATPRVG